MPIQFNFPFHNLITIDAWDKDPVTVEVHQHVMKTSLCGSMINGLIKIHIGSRQGCSQGAGRCPGYGGTVGPIQQVALFS